MSKYVKQRLSPTDTIYSVSLIWFFQPYVSMKCKMPLCLNVVPQEQLFAVLTLIIIWYAI